MDIQEILDMWEVDGVIDQFKLDDTTIKNATLHSKYLSLITVAKLKKKTIQQSYDNLLKDKWLWYNGKMDEETVREKGWEPDPFNGLKIMKNDMQIFFNADKDLQDLNAKIEYLKVTVDFLKECMQNITWRHQTIRNTIDWRKFMAGQ